MQKWSSLCIPWVVEVGGVYNRSLQVEVQYFIFISISLSFYSIEYVLKNRLK